MKHRIYLDVCCFNRPFDDQSQLVVRLQTEAKLDIQLAVKESRLEMVWSEVLDLENRANPDHDRSEAVGKWGSYANLHIQISQEVETLANALSQRGIKAMDALHVACAITAKVDYFLTTDKALLRKMQKDSQITVLDPVDFVRLETGENNEK